MDASVPKAPRPAELSSDAGWYHDIRSREYVNEITGERVPLDGGGVFRHIDFRDGKPSDSFIDSRPICAYCRTRIRVDSRNQCVNCGATP